MTKFKRWLSWLVPVNEGAEGHFNFRGRILVRYEMYCSAVQTNQTLIAEKGELRALLGEATARQRNGDLVHSELKARLEKAEAKFEAACIVNHLQRQKQTAYERSVYAASMGGMILDNQEEIARIAREYREIKRLGGV